MRERGIAVVDYGAGKCSDMYVYDEQRAENKGGVIFRIFLYHNSDSESKIPSL